MPESFDRGALTEAVFYILLSMYTPAHGYAVMQKIRDMSGGRVNLGAGTLYGAINTLTDKKWIQSIENPQDSRKKEYLITDAGRLAVNAEIERLKELVGNGLRIAGGMYDENN